MGLFLASASHESVISETYILSGRADEQLEKSLPVKTSFKEKSIKGVDHLLAFKCISISRHQQTTRL